jgi:hypothetical protein
MRVAVTLSAVLSFWLKLTCGVGDWSAAVALKIDPVSLGGIVLALPRDARFLGADAAVGSSATNAKSS